MRSLRLSLVSACFALVLAITAQHSFAQSATPRVQPIHQSIVLTPGVKQKMFFAIRALGSVKGQVLMTGSNPAGDQKGINGVKVTLRSRDAAYKLWFWEQHTDEVGNYVYENLRPGKYTIEIDPADLPAELSGANGTTRMPSPQIDTTAVNKGSLNGTVFIDKNRNGKYDAKKDTSIAGAVVTGPGVVATSDASGAYTLSDVPLGRVSVVVQWPHRSEKTHLLLDLPSATLARTIDIHPIY